MRGGVLLCVAMVFAGGSWAPAATEGYFDLQPGVTLETGDTWITDGKRYRLYGVQSCLRGTAYTDRSGEKQDCGEASLAMLAAYIRDTSPVCAPVAESAGAIFVACYATIAGERLDLANILIASGFAFAALDAGGMPFHAPYAVVEQQAREGRTGLWQFDDVQHPSLLLSRAANERVRKSDQ